MAKKKNKKEKAGNDKSENKIGSSIINSLKNETVEAIIAIVFIVLSIFMLLSPFEKAGPVGDFSFKILTKLLGVGYYLLPIVLIVLGVYYIKSTERDLTWTKSIGAILFVISGIGMIDLIFNQGGFVGGIISTPLMKLFDFWVSLVILTSTIVISVLMTFNCAISFEKISGLFRRKQNNEDEEDEDVEISVGGVKESELDKKEAEDNKKEDGKNDDAPIKINNNESKEKKGGEGLVFFSKKNDWNIPYKNPPLSLLQKDHGKPGVGDIKASANIIKRTLSNFGIQVEMDEVSVGPSVTRYALKPAEGVKLSKIVALQNDLSLALAAHPLRIEAPIPGKSLVGIEIPNTTKTTVGLGSMFKEDEYQNSDKSLILGMGKGVTGRSYFTNLGKAPHMLIAGATGSGKSVTIHALITSLLYRNSPKC